jgi:alanine-synthesizing transaminase
MLSRRTRWDAPQNRLTRARAERSRNGLEILDLTESNPTRAAIDYPLDELAAVMERAARAPYEPDSLGLRSAREAIGAEIGCDANDLLITASTSEAYSFLFKLLCNPGDNVVVATPSYPLFEHLAALELVELRTFALDFHRRWEMHADRVREVVDERTRAIIVVNPNNPTGSFVDVREQEALASIGLPIISDEVFLQYSLEGRGQTFVRDDLLTFTLGGLSKSAGLPHYKLGWIRVFGAQRAEALQALELIADSFLSVATPVQAALPSLLPIGARIRATIQQRTHENLDVLRNAIGGNPSMQMLPVEGGWSAVVRLPRVETDEDLALRLLDRGVLVHPGYFFDFAQEGHIVLSLLTEPATFARGVERL